MSAWMRAQESGRGRVPVIDEEEWETMISDDERREVAARLRDLLAIPWYERPWSRNAMQSLGEMVGAVPGEDIVERLADLIDRPTCKDVCNLDYESFKCSRCGCSVISLGGDMSDAVVVSPDGLISEYYYCPNCGAMVTEVECFNVPEL